MNGRDLALGAVGALALVGMARHAGSQARRSYRYFHVTTVANANAILSSGVLKPGDGICGHGVYLWDDVVSAEMMLEDFGDSGVILEVDAGDTDLSGCASEDIAGEGDADYYEHVAVVKTRHAWRPAAMRVRDEATGSAVRVPTLGRWRDMDPGARARLYRGAPPPVYPARSAHGWRLALANPFRPTGDVRTYRYVSSFGNDVVQAEHAGFNADPRRASDGTPMREPWQLLQTWVRRQDGIFVSSESYLSAHLYLEPPTRAQFEDAWSRTRLPRRDPEAIAAWLPGWVTPSRPMAGALRVKK